jgi:integrase
MASIIKEPNGRRRIEFLVPDPELPRQRIRLGKMNQRNAEAIKTKIEHLIAASVSGCGWDNDLSAWVARIGDDLADKLAELKLIPPRDRIICPGLKTFVESLRDSRPNLKPNTRRNYDQTIRRMSGYFGDDRKLDSISCGDADQWRDQMLKDGLAPATVGREIKRARQFFRVAVRRKLIEENPFTEVNAPAQVNTSREHFITREVTEKVLAACPDAEWRLIVALSRYGGLRCPSEHLALRWDDIDWEDGRINLPSPKTEHLPGGAFRAVPIFAELRPHLAEVFDQAEPGTVYVINRYRDNNQNLRTQFQRILRRAGVQPWERLFHNLRASRETELTENYPLHVVCSWIGNSAAIAAKHYLQVTDSHFAKAAVTGQPGASDGASPKSGAECGAQDVVSEAQNEAQHRVATNSTDTKNIRKPRRNRTQMQTSAASCDTALVVQIPRTGVEPVLPP